MRIRGPGSGINIPDPQHCPAVVQLHLHLCTNGGFVCLFDEWERLCKGCSTCGTCLNVFIPPLCGSLILFSTVDPTQAHVTLTRDGIKSSQITLVSRTHYTTLLDLQGILKGYFLVFSFFHARYSTLLHLSPIGFYC